MSLNNSLFILTLKVEKNIDISYYYIFLHSNTVQMLRKVLEIYSKFGFLIELKLNSISKNSFSHWMESQTCSWVSVSLVDRRTGRRGRRLEQRLTGLQRLLSLLLCGLVHSLVGDLQRCRHRWRCAVVIGKWLNVITIGLVFSAATVDASVALPVGRNASVVIATEPTLGTGLGRTSLGILSKETVNRDQTKAIDGLLHRICRRSHRFHRRAVIIEDLC